MVLDTYHDCDLVLCFRVGVVVATGSCCCMRRLGVVKLWHSKR